MIIMSRTGHLIHTWRIARWWTQMASKALSLFSVLLIIHTVLFPVASLQAAPAQPGDYVRYFPDTGHNLSGQANAFYARHGGQAIFGLPITEVITDGEVRVQYFERARFELRPTGIALTLIGRAVSAECTDPAFAWLAESTTPHRTYHPQSGHTLGGAFDWFWRSHGSLAIFGYPISEEFVEDGVLVQYFERARFEYRPEHVGTEVQISMLGRAYAQGMSVPAELLAPAPPIVQHSTTSSWLHRSSIGPRWRRAESCRSSRPSAKSRHEEATSRGRQSSTARCERVSAVGFAISRPRSTAPRF